MNDLMIDIETLGTAPGSVILSIGAVEFDAVSGKIGRNFYSAIDIQSCIEAGLKIGASTLKWWMTQADEARSSAFSGDAWLSPALSGLEMFHKTVNPDRVWAKSPWFDMTLLEAAYAACQLDHPWDFRSLRDCRTLFELSNTKQPEVGTAHNALDDAMSQAQGVIIAYEALGKAVR